MCVTHPNRCRHHRHHNHNRTQGDHSALPGGLGATHRVNPPTHPVCPRPAGRSRAGSACAAARTSRPPQTGSPPAAAPRGGAATLPGTWCTHAHVQARARAQARMVSENRTGNAAHLAAEGEWRWKLEVAGVLFVVARSRGREKVQLDRLPEASTRHDGKMARRASRAVHAGCCAALHRHRGHAHHPGAILSNRGSVSNAAFA